MCLSPVSIKNPNYLNDSSIYLKRIHNRDTDDEYVTQTVFPIAQSVHTASITVPCGKCIECQSRVQKDWFQRMKIEFKRYDHCSYITLTYNNAFLPVADVYDSSTGELIHENVPYLLRKDFQDFLKRFRYYLKRDYNVTDFKYFGCGELGNHHFRPHAHFIFFGLKPSQAQDCAHKAWSKRVDFRYDDRNLCIVPNYRVSDKHSKNFGQWCNSPMGYIDCDGNSITEGALNYVSKYCAKPDNAFSNSLDMLNAFSSSKYSQVVKDLLEIEYRSSITVKPFRMMSKHFGDIFDYTKVSHSLDGIDSHYTFDFSVNPKFKDLYDKWIVSYYDPLTCRSVIRPIWDMIDYKNDTFKYSLPRYIREHVYSSSQKVAYSDNVRYRNFLVEQMKIDKFCINTYGKTFFEIKASCPDVELVHSYLQPYFESSVQETKNKRRESFLFYLEKLSKNKY